MQPTNIFTERNHFCSTGWVWVDLSRLKECILYVHLNFVVTSLRLYHTEKSLIPVMMMMIYGTDHDEYKYRLPSHDVASELMMVVSITYINCSKFWMAAYITYKISWKKKCLEI